MSNEPFNPFEFLTSPWGKLPLGGAIPGVSGFNAADLKDLDKRIQELKAVEQWLDLNLNLLKTTIQGLEVQRGTVAAIQSFTESMTKAGADPVAATKPTTSTDPLPGLASKAATEQATYWWESMQQQFGQMMQAAQAGAQSMADQATKPAKKSTTKTAKSTKTPDKA